MIKLFVRRRHTLFGMSNVQIVNTAICIILGFGAISHAGAQQADKRIDEIRRLYKEVTEQISTAEKEKPYSTIFCDELVRNVNENPWPAVGIFKSVTKAHYTFSRREGEPYPNKLLQITVATQRSDRHEYAEYLFNASGQLVFALEKPDDDPNNESRYYFANGRPIRIIRDQKILKVPNGADLKSAQEALAEGLRLRRLFVLG
ncbi:MAG TPA: hypothetical protein VN643_18900 [Pyrinomonadaceae bacterium]|nr:hypothetical protein [Pyrinomonadaceae bacterium]